MLVRIKVIACETIKSEIMEAVSNQASMESVSIQPSYIFLEHGLHRRPELMKDRIQEHIDSSHGYDLVVLGYGLCSNGVLGVRARECPIVIPRVEDCIALLLGSREAYLREFAREPGTYYLTPGWIKYGGDPLKTYREYSEKYDRETALWITREMMKHYTRVAYIRTEAEEGKEGPQQLGGGEEGGESLWQLGGGIIGGPEASVEEAHKPCSRDWRAYAREVADFLGMRYEELEGSLDLLKRLVPRDGAPGCEGGSWKWDDDFVLLWPGEELTVEKMRTDGISREGRGFEETQRIEL